ncbi:hypothetical protein [Dyadobacter sp. LHD-138]|uniref:hypothetical protein n=1 Tax=Dyadobacter sp. LHD-138 TaxID=3071413 RepID=UPI0027DF3E86|nr:hypothetical protein [Dyadobacter sp. LHD-138]MDQ6479814.1 hypothetical protein [Dyadobacter sp. LHD-138]
MENIQRIDISPFPGYPDVARKIAVVGKNEDYKNGSVTLICQIEHYDQVGKRLNVFAAIERDPFLLVADDTSMVNSATGALVFKDENGHYPAGSVGQYTWLKLAVESGANPFTISEGAVLEASALGRFN